MGRESETGERIRSHRGTEDTEKKGNSAKVTLNNSSQPPSSGAVPAYALAKVAPEDGGEEL